MRFRISEEFDVSFELSQDNVNSIISCTDLSVDFDLMDCHHHSGLFMCSMPFNLPFLRRQGPSSSHPSSLK